jgi:predicted RNA binding protein YcfA (HicA-like mRNA interferase family)
MNGYYAQVIAVLKRHGYYMSRQKGSHQTWTNGKRPVTVSTNCDSRFTANAIMKQAGINQRF